MIRVSLGHCRCSALSRIRDHGKGDLNEHLEQPARWSHKCPRHRLSLPPRAPNELPACTARASAASEWLDAAHTFVML